jgi:hypothetical protein
MKVQWQSSLDRGGCCSLWLTADWNHEGSKARRKARKEEARLKFKSASLSSSCLCDFVVLILGSQSDQQVASKSTRQRPMASHAPVSRTDAHLLALRASPKSSVRWPGFMAQFRVWMRARGGWPAWLALNFGCHLLHRRGSFGVGRGGGTEASGLRLQVCDHQQRKGRRMWACINSNSSTEGR